jgi:hypothetical protein
MKFFYSILAAAALAITFSCRFPEKYYPLPGERGPDIYGLEIILPAGRLFENESVRAQAMAILSSGKKMTLDAGEVSWDSMNSDIVSVDAKGTVIGVSPGSGEIRIRMGEGTLSACREITVERSVDYRRLMISEVLCDPAGTDEGREFIEIYNDNEYGFDIGGMQIVDGSLKSAPFVFPAGSFIDAKSHAVIAQTEDGFFSLFGLWPDYSGFSFSLNNTGETVLLMKQDGTPVDEVFIKGGTPELPAPESWGSGSLPSAASGNSVNRINFDDTDTFSDWETAPPSPWM